MTALPEVSLATRLQKDKTVPAQYCALVLCCVDNQQSGRLTVNDENRHDEVFGWVGGVYEESPDSGLPAVTSSDRRE